MVAGDGHLFVQRSRGRFDFIVLDLPPPVTMQLNRFYSREGLTAQASFGQALPLFCAKEPGTLAEDLATWQQRLAEQGWPGVSAVRPGSLAEGLGPWRRRAETLVLTGPHQPNRDPCPLALLYTPQLWGV